MKEVIFCAALGYLLGSVSFAAIISELHNKDIHDCGSGNPGATNVFLFVGKKQGVMVMLFDVFKAYLAVTVSIHLFGSVNLGAFSGVSAIYGHMFPAYMHFKGGKGLACLGGVGLALNKGLFIAILIIAIMAALVVNYACTVAIITSLLFPLSFGVMFGSRAMVCLFIPVCVTMLYKHRDNIARIRNHTETPIRKR